MKRDVEILAPAGSYDSFLAAVHAGSDAVYLGGTLFSARASADNFTQEQLLEALDYAHLHGRRVYMTVNTLLKETEIKLLPEYLLPYYERGLDAVIVQDVGVLKTVAENFPDLSIHLSTQMTLTGSMGAESFRSNGETARGAGKYYVTRLVPARELSLEELKGLREETDLELEVFVHGALCVCYSGQCFLSSMIGGRSGNRGRCAQPCRKLYSSPDSGQKSYILSPKDLCTLEMMPDLIEAGIDSFKIEGRMKKPEYTAYISWLYRKYANRYLQYGRKEYEAYLRKYPKELEEDLRGMKDLYNRGGFTRGYFIQHNGRGMMSLERPNHEGVFVGTVTSVKGRKEEICWQQEIHPQDILEIRSGGKKIYEYTMGSAQKSGEKSYVFLSGAAGAREGMKVFRTRNNSLIAWIDTNLIGNPVKMELYGRFSACAGMPACLEIEARSYGCSKISVAVNGEICQKAQKQPITEEMVRRQLSRLGDTEFVWKELEIQLGHEVFVPVKGLNELRRRALEAFREQYLRRFDRKWEKAVPKLEKISKCMEKKPQIAAEVLTAEQWRAALDSPGIYIIYVRMEILEKKEIVSLAEATVKGGRKCFLSLPAVLHRTTRNLAREMILMLASEKLCDGILVHNMEELGFVKTLIASERGISADMEKLEITANFSMYSTNSQAVRFWREQGCSRVTAPIEQNRKELKELFSMEEPGVEKEIQVYGRLPLMISAQCITSYGKNRDCIKSPGMTVLMDEWEETLYAMNFCRFCYNILYSGKVYDLRGEGEELLQIPFSVWRCSFTDETAQETKSVLKDLKTNLEGKGFSGSEGAWTGHFHKGMI